MKNALIAFAFLASASAALAETAVSDISIRQLWPWSGDVDIAFTVEGDDADAPVKFTAQYDGVEPFELAEKDLSGDFFVAKAGRRHVRWSPKSAGLDAKTLFNFHIVSAAVDGTVGTRTYLVLDLATGDYTYMDAEPEGGWTADPSYCQTKMVFRRIPAGTKTLGLSEGLRTLSSANGSTDNCCKEHVATISSDYYLGVFPVTAAQHTFAVGGARDVADKGILVNGGTYKYLDIRGEVADGIDWPNTGYAVSSNSYLAAFRKVAKISADWALDLPTVVQWEYAARATTPSDQLWSVGGKVGDDAAALSNCVSQIATWKGNYTKDLSTKVGQHLPNGWGLYDMVGLVYEWNLDWYANSTTSYSGMDPIGPTSGSFRSRRSANTDYAITEEKGFKFLTTSAIGTNGAESKHNYRLCIHMKRLVK